MVKNNKCIINIPVNTPDILDYIKFLVFRHIEHYGIIDLADLKNICSDIIDITIEKKYSDIFYYYSSGKSVKYITISEDATTKSIIFDNLKCRAFYI